MKSSYKFFAIIFACLNITACTRKEPLSPYRPQLAKNTMTVPVSYAGETVQIWFQTKRKDLSAGQSVDITLENGIPQLSDDTWIDSTSFASKLTGSDGTYSFDCPTTVDFKPGMWHVKSISIPVKKGKPIELLQGRDFSGIPFYVVNARKPSAQEGTLQFDGIKSVTP